MPLMATVPSLESVFGSSRTRPSLAGSSVTWRTDWGWSPELRM